MKHNEGRKRKLDEDQESGFPIAFKVRSLKEVLEENHQVIQERGVDLFGKFIA